MVAIRSPTPSPMYARKKEKEQLKKQQINHSNIDYKGNIPSDFDSKEYLELVDKRLFLFSELRWRMMQVSLKIIDN